jgi:hypothetical protein
VPARHMLDLFDLVNVDDLRFVLCHKISKHRRSI